MLILHRPSTSCQIINTQYQPGLDISQQPRGERLYILLLLPPGIVQPLTLCDLMEHIVNKVVNQACPHLH